MTWEETRARLSDDADWWDSVPAGVRADIRAALELADRCPCGHIGCEGTHEKGLFEMNERLRQRVEELEREKKFAEDNWARAGSRAEAAEAKLARCVEALEQIDRETHSASDVAALRYGSIARAALAAAKGE